MRIVLSFLCYVHSRSQDKDCPVLIPNVRGEFFWSSIKLNNGEMTINGFAAKVLMTLESSP